MRPRNSAYGPRRHDRLDRRRHLRLARRLDVDAVWNLAHRRQIESERAGLLRFTPAGDVNRRGVLERALFEEADQRRLPEPALVLDQLLLEHAARRHHVRHAVRAVRAARGGPQRPQDRSRACGRRRIRATWAAQHAARATARNTDRRACCDWKYQTFTPSTSTAVLCGTGESPGPSTLVVNTCTSWPRRASARHSPCTDTIVPP